MDKELICVCGDSENMHVDGCEQCFEGGCGCKEFEEKGMKYFCKLPHMNGQDGMYHFNDEVIYKKHLEENEKAGTVVEIIET